MGASAANPPSPFEPLYFQHNDDYGRVLRPVHISQRRTAAPSLIVYSYAGSRAPHTHGVILCLASDDATLYGTLQQRQRTCESAYSSTASFVVFAPAFSFVRAERCPWAANAGLDSKKGEPKTCVFLAFGGGPAPADERGSCSAQRCRGSSMRHSPSG